MCVHDILCMTMLIVTTAPPIPVSQVVVDPKENDSLYKAYAFPVQVLPRELADPKELFEKQYFLPIARVEGEESMLNKWGPPSIYSTMK